MKLDLAKTQFLVTQDNFLSTIKAYRRKRATMLFDRDGEPVRLITMEDWRALKSAYPNYVAEDGLTIRTVWTLVPVR